MTLCAKLVFVASAICSAVATVLMLVAIATPSWRHVYVKKDDGVQVIDAKEGLWQVCRDGVFKYKGCSQLHPKGIGPWFDVVRALTILSFLGYFVTFATTVSIIVFNKLSFIKQWKGIVCIVTVTISAFLAFLAAELYSHHVDYDKTRYATQTYSYKYNASTGCALYSTFMAAGLGIAALFLSSLTMFLTRDAEAYQTIYGYNTV